MSDQPKKRDSIAPPRLSTDETLELLASVMQRSAIDRQEAAVEILRKKYPDAPDEMLRTAAFHVYFDLPTQMIDFAVKIELSLRKNEANDFYGEIFGILYNLYNALMFERLVPEGKAGLIEQLDEIQECLKAKDYDCVQHGVEVLKRALDGSESPPDFD